MDNALEARPQRVRHHLRRPLAGSRGPTNENRGKHPFARQTRRWPSHVGEVAAVHRPFLLLYWWVTFGAAGSEASDLCLWWGWAEGEGWTGTNG